MAPRITAENSYEWQISSHRDCSAAHPSLLDNHLRGYGGIGKHHVPDKIPQHYEIFTLSIIAIDSSTQSSTHLHRVPVTLDVRGHGVLFLDIASLHNTAQKSLRQRLIISSRSISFKEFFNLYNIEEMESRQARKQNPPNSCHVLNSSLSSLKTT